MNAIINFYSQNKLSGPSYDSDAQAFFNAANITDTTEKNAVDTFVKSLKTVGSWSKLDFIYPFVGGSTFSCSFNLKNTSQYRISWTGTIIATNKGVSENSNGAFGDTGWKPKQASHFLLKYENIASGNGYNGVGPSPYLIIGQFNAFVEFFSGGPIGGAGQVMLSTGFTTILNVTNANLAEGWTDALGSSYTSLTKRFTNTNTRGTIPNNNFYLFSISTLGDTFSENGRRYATYIAGDALTDSEVIATYNAVRTLNQSLNRDYLQ